MTTLIEKENYLNALLDTKDNVIGEIYMIINLLNMKTYIGQSASHRKNKNKYRPFGYRRRLDDHFSEASHQTKPNQSVYLNNAIRKYGTESFSVELIRRCELCEMDNLEQYYVEYYQTLFPNGYNLTIGGRGQFYVASVPNNNIVMDRVKYTHSEETKQKISDRLQQVMNMPVHQQRSSQNAQKQHDQAKVIQFSHCMVDHDHLDQYLHEIHSLQTGQFSYYRIYLDGKRVDFRGKFQTQEQMKDRALSFLRQLPPFSAQ